MTDIISPDDPRVHVSLTFHPRKPLKPFTITVPRFDFLDEDAFDAMTAELKTIPAKDEAGQPISVRKTTRSISLTMLKHAVTSAQFAKLEKCTTGELDMALATWTKASQVELGELLASSNSSTESTGRPSKQTSSSADTPDETSDADSPGVTSESS